MLLVSLGSALAMLVSISFARAYGSSSWPAVGSDDSALLSCDPLACIYRRDGLTVALIRDARALAEDCVIADLVVASVPVPRSCRADIVIDRFDVWRHGAHAVTLAPEGPVVARVADRIGLRPWTLDRRPDWERVGPSD